MLEKQTTKSTKEDGDKNSREQDDFFKAKLLKAEVSIREELRKEYERKIAKIEDTYRNIFEVNQQKLNKYKQQENNYRHQLADLLDKYGQMISPIQKENSELKEHIRKIEAHCNELKKYVETSKKEYNLALEKTQKDAQKSIDAWKMWAKNFVQGCLSIEKLNAKSRNTILNSLKEFDSQVDSVDKYFEEKIRQYKTKINLGKT
ncbi:hypothetical protein HHI36_008607 [Cryptolaemus montrouzieri]|uniref:Uncharacterized protein n=1 Tax=Cryptolaemus montrouzieri TaxID=559131 RepID=A0ABD2MTH1_9CUCU